MRIQRKELTSIMPSTQNQPRETTGRSRKIKKIAIIVIIILSACAFVRCCVYFWPDEYSSKIYGSSADFIDTFNNNREDFEQLVAVADGSELWDYLFNIGKPYIFSPNNIRHWKDYLTEEEHELICGFMETYGPHSIRDYYHKYFYMSFYCKSETIGLYYIELEGDELERRLLYLEQDADEVIHINDEWYLVVYKEDFVRGD